jgi:hypothetical protein
VRKTLGDIAAPGEKFDATDVVVTRIHYREIFVWSRGNRWVVAIEHGGLGYNDPVFAYDLNADLSEVIPVTKRIAFPHNVCDVARDLLDLHAQP